MCFVKNKIKKINEYIESKILQEINQIEMKKILDKYPNIYKFNYIGFIKMCIRLNRLLLMQLFCRRLHTFYLHRNFNMLMDYTRKYDRVNLKLALTTEFDCRDYGERLLSNGNIEQFMEINGQHVNLRHLHMALYSHNAQLINHVVKFKGYYSAISATLVDPDIRCEIYQLIDRAGEKELKTRCRFSGNTLLHDAVQIGDVSIVKKLLSLKIFTCNELNFIKQTPLFRIRHDLPELINLLITKENYIFRDAYRNTALHNMAHKKNIIRCVKRYISLATVYTQIPKSIGYRLARTQNDKHERPIDIAGGMLNCKLIRYLLKFEPVSLHANPYPCVLPAPLRSIICSHKKIHKSHIKPMQSVIRKLFKKTGLEQLKRCRMLSFHYKFPTYISEVLNRQISSKKLKLRNSTKTYINYLR